MAEACKSADHMSEDRESAVDMSEDREAADRMSSDTSDTSTVRWSNRLPKREEA